MADAADGAASEPPGPDESQRSYEDLLPAAKRLEAPSKTRVCSLSTVPMLTARVLSSVFSALAGKVLDYPLVPLVASVLMLGACMGAFFGLQEVILDAEELWNPTDMPGYKNTQAIRKVFPERQRVQELLFHNDGGDILSQAFLVALVGVHQRFDRDWRYQDLCARPAPWAACPSTSILQAWGFSRAAIEADDALHDTLTDYMRTSANTQFNMSVQVERGEGGGVEKVVSAIDGWRYWPHDSMSRIESAFIDFGLDEWPTYRTGIVAEVKAQSSFDRELQSILARDVILIIVSIVLVIGFTAIVLGDLTLIGSRVLLGACGAVVMMASYVIGVGILIFCGQKMTVVTPLVMFVLVGIGVDDMFIIVDAYVLNVDIADLKERMMKSLSTAGPAIALTTISDICAFGVGSTATMPGVSSFTITALVVLTVDFVLQVTVFVICLHWDELRIRANRMDLFFWVKLPHRYTTPWELCCRKRRADDALGQSGSSSSGPARRLRGEAAPKHLAILPQPMERRHTTAVMTPPPANPLQPPPRTGRPATAPAGIVPVACDSLTELESEPEDLDSPTGEDRRPKQRPVAVIHAPVAPAVSVVPMPVTPQRESSARDPPQVLPPGTTATRSYRSSGQLPEHDVAWSRRIINKYYAPAVTSPVGRVAVVLGFVAWAVVSILWYPQVGEGLGRDDTLPADSYIVRFQKLQEHYYTSVPTPLTVMVKDPHMDYSDPAVLELFKDLKGSLEADPSISLMPIWFLDFAQWRAAHKQVLPNHREYRQLFLPHLWDFLGAHPPLLKHIVVDNATGTVAAMRFVGLQRFAEAAMDRINDMQNTRAAVARWQARSGVTEVYLSTRWYPFEDANRTIRQMIFDALFYAIIAILCVLLFFIPPMMALIVTFTVAMIDNALLGIMYPLDINFSSVSYIVIAMSVGLSVDYCAHIGIGFTNCRRHESADAGGGRSAPEYAREALNEVGSCVLSGGFSTLLGIAALGFATSETFFMFFKLLFCSVLFGIVHGIVFLPALLSCLPRCMMRFLVLPPPRP